MVTKKGSITEILGGKASRGYIQVLTDLEIWRFWFNPNEVRVSHAPDYDKSVPIGMSHGYHGFKSTANARIAFALYYNKFMLRLVTEKMLQSGNAEESALASEALLYEGTDGRAFLESLQIPELPEDVGPQEAVLGASPPAVRLGLLNLLDMRARLTKLEFRFTNFDGSMMPIEFLADVEFEEAPVTRMTRQMVRTCGYFR